MRQLGYCLGGIAWLIDPKLWGIDWLWRKLMEERAKATFYASSSLGPIYRLPDGRLVSMGILKKLAAGKRAAGMGRF